jgi:endogenous inhibitor of DNA gyrase (YacG/DUF329 family)
VSDLRRSHGVARESTAPFLLLTCRLVDLGLWLDGRYRIEAADDDLLRVNSE